MSLDAPNLVLEDAMVKACFEFTLAGGGGGHLVGRLATTEDDEVFLGGDSRRFERSIRNVGFQEVERSCGYYLLWLICVSATRSMEMMEQVYFGSFVFRGGDEVGSVGRPLEICDSHAVCMGRKVSKKFPGLSGINKEFSGSGAGALLLRRIATPTHPRDLQ